MLGFLRPILSNQRGSAVVEMGIVMPFLVVLGFGIFEFGNLLYQHHLIETGLKDAARYLARRPDPAAEATVGQELAVMGEIGGTTKRVSWWNTSDVSVSIATVANPIDATTGEKTYRGPDPISIVRVSTSATYNGIGFLQFLGVGNSISFNLYHEERVIGE